MFPHRLCLASGDRVVLLTVVSSSVEGQYGGGSTHVASRNVPRALDTHPPGALLRRFLNVVFLFGLSHT